MPIAYMHELQLSDKRDKGIQGVLLHGITELGGGNSTP